MTHPHPASAHSALRRRLGVLAHRWHRRTGLFAALFLAWLALSGLLMNEAATLGLDAVRLDWPWLMRAYGLQAPAPEAYALGEHWLVMQNDALSYDGRPLQPPVAAAVGAVAFQDMSVIATADSLVLLRAGDGLRIDELRAPTLPSGAITRLGLSGPQLRVTIGGQDYVSPDTEQWAPAAAAEPVQWAQTRPLPAAQRDALHLRPSLPLTRVLADLHSGTVFGRSGKTLIDLTALAALLLVGSGVWVVLRRRHHHSH